jgi:hypothetical protein
MFVVTTLVYPVALAALCLGAGLLTDRLTGAFLPGALLVTVGAAALIAISQLTTYVHAIAPATPYLMAAVATAGFAVSAARVRSLARRMRERPWLLALSIAAYAAALAPVLLAGRPTFSSFMALSDSAVHMIGADFLIHHGQSFAHLDLRNSYGQFIDAYYNSGYPSGADTFFGGSALLLRLPLIWAFQPFNAFVLASAVGPAWLLAQRIGLAGPWAALAALSAALPALVYAYELLGSVKEITVLSLLLTLGCLVVSHRDWLGGPPARAIPFALVLAGGVSALGIGFGAWGLGALAVLAAIALGGLRAGRRSGRQLFYLAAAGALAALIAALPTWAHLSDSLRVARDIGSTANSGNLHAPLRTIQVAGVWLHGSYKLAPAGAALPITHALIVITFAAAALGALHLLRMRSFALAAWIACMLLVWLIVSESVTTWAGAKTLVLSSPVLMLLAWAGLAAMRQGQLPTPVRAIAWLPALAIAGGVLVSDALQYHSSNLAPTSRYRELASVGSRFAGKGPALFTDFDEYALYGLRKLDIGGPDFVYPPPALAGVASGYGRPVDLDRARPSALAGYPLIVTRRDPAASRPPAAYRLLWQGAYYQVWGRRVDTAPALAHLALSGSAAAQCRRLGQWAGEARDRSRRAPARAGRLIAADAPEVIRLALARSAHPARWGHQRGGLVMARAGRLSVGFAVPAAGAWDVWIQGQFMPEVKIALDGRALATIEGELSGNSLVVDTAPPRRVELAAGAHRLTVTRSGTNLAPGNGGWAILDSVFLTPARDGAGSRLSEAASRSWRSLCGRTYEWAELLAA